jgi:hypothetical protein
MSLGAAGLLDRLRALGASACVHGDRLRITAPHALPLELLDALRAHKADVLALLAPPPRPAPTAALGVAYRRWFALTVAEADGTPTDPAEAATLHQRIVRLTDDAGPLWADAVFANELRRFRRETGRCGLCGGLGHPQDDA